MILDLGMPNVDGIDVIRAVRAWSKVPILVLSGRTDSAEKVDALDAGADDYVTKCGALPPNDAGYLRLYVAQLRRKLEPVPSAPRHFLNEPGLGYRFEP